MKDPDHVELSSIANIAHALTEDSVQKYADVQSSYSRIAQQFTQSTIDLLNKNDATKNSILFVTSDTQNRIDTALDFIKQADSEDDFIVNAVNGVQDYLSSHIVDDLKKENAKVFIFFI